MNQQRSRRFRAARDNKIKQELEKERIEQALKNGLITEEEANTSRIINENKRNFDSNCITPGTEFMDKVANALRWYAYERMNNCPAWKNLQVIISDASVPGEGEHKIIEFIRKQKELPMYDPNTSHVLYGLDADLIMLGISTHEPNFTILREYVSDRNSDFDMMEYDKKHIPYQFLKINVLREYLENDLYVENLPFKWDLERALDDYVFMCFFVGNDFLPHLPTLNIRERAIDFLIEVYRKLLPSMGGYITENGDVNLIRAEMLLSAVGEAEDRILRDRLEKAKRYQERKKNNRNKAIADALRNGNTENIPVYEEEEEVYDPVRLGEEGWKERYYKEKFGKSLHDEEFINDISKAYVEGLVWVMKYYYQGCSSWTWYYPYHYAPFAGELKDLEKFIPIKFEKGSPFLPYEQLMSVLPSASAHCLPEIYHWYMKDKNSCLYEYYPLDFEIDMNGQKQEWRGVALLPFIDEKKLLSTIRPLHEKLTGKEKKRNTFGKDLYLVHSESPVGKYIMKTLYEKSNLYEEKHGINKDDEEKYAEVEKNVSIQLQPKLSKSISGTLSPVNFGDIGGTINIESHRPIHKNKVYAAHFANPVFPEKYVFVPRVLENAVMPPRVLSDVELLRRRKIRHFGNDMSATRILEYVTNSNRLYNERKFQEEGNVVKGTYRMTDRKPSRYEPYAKKTGHKQQYHQGGPSQHHLHQQYQQPPPPYQYPPMLLQPNVPPMGTPYQPYPNLQYPVYQGQYPPQQIPYNPYQQTPNPYQIQQSQPATYPYQQPQHQPKPQPQSQQYHVKKPQQQSQQYHVKKPQQQSQQYQKPQQRSQYQTYFKKR